MEPIKYQVIGVIHSPFKQAKGTPIQASAAYGVKGQVRYSPNIPPDLATWMASLILSCCITSTWRHRHR
jgi:hypothetical protein